MGAILGLSLNAVYARLVAYRWFLAVIALLDSTGAVSELLGVAYDCSGSSIITMRYKLEGFESYHTVNYCRVWVPCM